VNFTLFQVKGDVEIVLYYTFTFGSDSAFLGIFKPFNSRLCAPPVGRSSPAASQSLQVAQGNYRSMYFGLMLVIPIRVLHFRAMPIRCGRRRFCWRNGETRRPPSMIVIKTMDRILLLMFILLSI
jgi:hypothetical protein